MKFSEFLTEYITVENGRLIINDKPVHKDIDLSNTIDTKIPSVSRPNKMFKTTISGVTCFSLYANPRSSELVSAVKKDVGNPGTKKFINDSAKAFIEHIKDYYGKLPDNAFVVTIKSSSSLLNDFCGEIETISGGKVKVMYDAFLKPPKDSEQVIYDFSTIKDMEKSDFEKLKAEVEHNVKYAMKDGKFEMKKIRPSIRKFIRLNIDANYVYSYGTEKYTYMDLVEAKKVYIIDDAITEGTTIRSIIHTLVDEIGVEKERIEGFSLFKAKSIK